MDRRSWPWKKKSSDKAAAEKAATSATAPDSTTTAASESAASQADQSKQETYKKPKYVQISVESYTHLTGLEEQVKSYDEQVKSLEEEVKDLNEKLSAAQTEMTNKDNLVKQHAKVAEEAVSGWEKAEAEAATLKNHLESVTLLKLTAEDRASHLDGALKECMRQIRNLKEEHETKLHELALTKTKQFEKMKLELEAKIANLDQELLRSAAESAALSRSLQERSNMLINLSEEKSRAEADIEHLKNNVESCEKEINSLKYELHIAAKELEIRNEEKNMSVRSAEVANKQHMEGVKKIAKLEAECQRLRGLVRKKLPGPAALAQMKLEVESLGRDHGDSRLRRSPVKPPSPHLSSVPEFSLESIQKYHKENELLTERLLAMEEETKMLKEALAKRNSELLTSRSLCAKTASKLQSLEAQMLVNGENRSPPKLNTQIFTEGSFSQNASNPPSLTSMSEDGNDDVVSCNGSWATTLVSDVSHLKKEKTIDSPNKSDNASHLDLMDDFLEMEKLAYQSNGSNGAVEVSEVPSQSRSAIICHDTPSDVTAARKSEFNEQHHLSSDSELSVLKHHHDSEPVNFTELQARISKVFESTTKDTDLEKVLEHIRSVVQDMDNSLHEQPLSVKEATHCSDTTCEAQTRCENSEIPAEKDICSPEDGKEHPESAYAISEKMVPAIAHIYDFVMVLTKDSRSLQESPLDGGLSENLEKFSATYNEVINGKTDVVDFIEDLSHILRKVSELQPSVLGYKNFEVETGSFDCIDKVALPENKGVLNSSEEKYPSDCAHFSDSTSDPDIPHEGNLVPTSDKAATSWKCSLEEFEQLKLERDSIMTDLAKCTEDLGSTKTQMQETEQLLAEVKSQLTAAQKLNSLAETQLKCMAESYKSLETRAEELQTEVNLLKGKTESLDIDLQEERRCHQDALARCKELQEQLQRIESCSDADVDAKTNQEAELAAAAEKLAECQETIFLLGRQLKALRPPTEFMGSPYSERSQKGETINEEEPTTSGMNSQDVVDPSEVDTATSVSLQRADTESPLDLYNAPYSPSGSEANNPLRSPISSKHPKHRPTKSASSSSSSCQTPEKHSRGISRFFSSKGKNNH